MSETPPKSQAAGMIRPDSDPGVAYTENAARHYGSGAWCGPTMRTDR